MADADAGTLRWALLAGIDFYRTRPLQGAVRDVEEIQQYLQTHYEAVDMQTLTASPPADAEALHPLETPESWPTYENVISGLDRITSKAQRGDFVYVHFSGHGTQRTDPKASNTSNINTGHLALVLYDSKALGGFRYLHGWILAQKMKTMVDKGLLVTLVLDCCFSGSVVRHGRKSEARIRTVAYDPDADTAHPSNLPSANTNPDTLRDAHLRPEWLINPDSYTILSACNPYENAGEYDDQGEMHGALSFMLRLALDYFGERVAFQSLYLYLCVLFREKYSRQTPMLFGNPERSFFEKCKPGLDITSVCVFRRNDRLCLEAGEAHGVCSGDEYAAYPANMSDNSKNLNQMSKRVKVGSVRGLTSDLIPVDLGSGGPEIKTGWRARPLTFLTPRKVNVRLKNTTEDADDDQLTGSPLEKRFLRLITKDEQDLPCDFSVKRNGRRGYTFLDQSDEEIFGLPAESYDENGAEDRMLSTLEHLATFKFFEQNDNQNSNLSFTAHLCDKSGVFFGPKEFLDHNENEDLTLTVQNLGSKDIYVALFDMGPSYQIDNLFPNEQFRPVPGKRSLSQSQSQSWPGKRVMEMQTWVPDSFKKKGLYHCHDTIKMFITSRPSLFRQFWLPRVTEEIQGPDRRAADDLKVSGLNRSVRDQEYDPFEGEWATQKFCVRTISKERLDMNSTK